MIIDAILPLWLIILSVAAFTIMFAYQEQKKSHRYKTFRMIAVALLMIAILGIALRPSYHIQKTEAILLLTPDYLRDVVDSVLDQNPLISVAHLEGTPPYRGSRMLYDHELASLSTKLSVVVGNGIPPHQLDGMNECAFTFFPGLPLAGITEINFPHYTFMNRECIVTGTYNHTGKGVHLVLSSPSGKEDSIYLTTQQQQFSLSFMPKQIGQFSYTLTVMDSIDSYIENIPVNVLAEQPLNVLMLQSYPTFETQYLKTFLEKRNHRVALRVQLSKNKYRYEFINQPTSNLNILTPGLFEKIDIVIIDRNTLESLPKTERTSLENAVRSGMGLLHGSDLKANPSSSLYPFKIEPVKNDTTVLTLDARTFSLLATKQRVELRGSITPLLQDKTGVLSGYSFSGFGRIGFTLLSETYRLALSGDSSAYSAIWTPLLESVSRPIERASKITLASPFPYYENDPIDIKVFSSTENISIQMDSIPLPLQEHWTIDNVWNTRIWAGQSGWHTLFTNDGTTLPFYVSDVDAWKSLALSNQLKANQLMKSKTTGVNKRTQVLQPISPVYFFTLFVFAAGFLWLAPKL